MCSVRRSRLRSNGYVFGSTLMYFQLPELPCQRSPKRVPGIYLESKVGPAILTKFLFHNDYVTHGPGSRHFLHACFLLFHSHNATAQPWLRQNDTDERNAKARKAYESLMTVTLRKPTSPEYRKFSEEVKARAATMYTNFTYGEQEV